MAILSVAIAKKVEKLKTFERFCESLYVYFFFESFSSFIYFFGCIIFWLLVVGFVL